MNNAPVNLNSWTMLANSLATDANYAAAIQSQLATRATVTSVTSGLAAKQPLSSSSDLAIGKLITRTWTPPTGITDTTIESNTVYLGNPIWLSATYTQVQFWSLVDIDQGLKVSNGLLAGTSCIFHFI